MQELHQRIADLESELAAAKEQIAQLRARNAGPKDKPIDEDKCFGVFLATSQKNWGIARKVAKNHLQTADRSVKPPPSVMICDLPKLYWDSLKTGRLDRKFVSQYRY